MTLSSPKNNLAAELGTLGYPGFAYIKGATARKPEQWLLEALDCSDLDPRVAEGLPWLVLTYLDMDGTFMNSLNGRTTGPRGYAPINGLKMYYEIEGTGEPLVYIPPAFGFAGLKSFPALVQSHSVITMDLQGNGRTPDIPERPISIEQYAKDVVGLLKHLGISKADFFGESYGGNAAALIAIRYPELVGRVVTYSATFGPPQFALNPETTHFDHQPTPEARNIQFQRENYKKVAPDPSYWPKIFHKVGAIQWNGFSKEELASIRSPILIVVGDHDFVRVEHAIETVKLIPNAGLAVIPDATLCCSPNKRE